MEKIKKGEKIYLVLGILLVLQIASALYFCGKKTGFHYDEYYSYYSSNVTWGLVPTDREWKPGSEIRNEFMVLPGEGFRFRDVVRMQTYDVHPPFYYLLLHAVCSLTPGVFSKWQGLALNLIFFAASWCILARLAFEMARAAWDREAGRIAAAAACLLYGFNPAVISGIMLVRMYMLLGLFVLLITWLHVKALNRNRRGRGFYLPVMLTVYLGFLTHYYFAVYMFFLAAAMECWLLFETVENKTWAQKWKDCFAYGIAVVGAMALAVVSYPACLGHIFRGYRGTEAMGEFFDVSNTAGRIRFFAGLLNEYVFGSMLPLLALVILLLCLTAWALRRMQKSDAANAARKEAGASGLRETETGASGEYGKQAGASGSRGREHRKQAGASEERGKEAGGIRAAERFRCILIPAAATAGYFAVVAKTALLTAEEANRYQIPVYGLILLLSVVGLYGLARRVDHLAAKRHALKGKTDGCRKMAVLLAGAVVILLAAGGLRGLIQGKVLFLYEEDAENIAFARENHDEAAVYFYNGNLVWMIWDDALELMQYDRIYFVNMADVSPVTDPVLEAADRALVYVARGDQSRAALEAAEAAFPDGAEVKQVRELLYCDLYEITAAQKEVK